MAFGFATTKKTGATAVSTLTTAAMTTSGNFLVLVSNHYNGDTPNAPTDSFGNTWIAATGSPKAVGGNTNIYVWYAQNATTGASHTFTLTTAAAANYSFSVIGMSARATSGTIDVQTTPSAESSAVTSHIGQSITPTVSGDDIIVAFGDDNATVAGSSDTWIAGASLTLPVGGYTSDGRDQPTSGVMYQENVGTSSISTAFNSGSATQAAFFVIAVKQNTTAPVLSSASGSANGSRAANGGVTTDTANGTLYAVLTTSATQPTKAQVKAGQNNAGAAAVYSNGGLAITSSGAKTVAASSGLTPKTAYYWHFMHESATGNQSNVLSSAGLTTHGEITDTDGDNTVNNGQTNVTINGYFGSSDPVVRIKSGSISQTQADIAHTSSTITLSSITRGNLPYTDVNHQHFIEVDTDE